MFRRFRRIVLLISANYALNIGVPALIEPVCRLTRRCLSDWLETAVLHLFAQLISACEGYQPSLGPPVLNASIAGGGQYAFVEFRDETICETAMQFTGAMRLE